MDDKGKAQHWAIERAYAVMFPDGGGFLHEDGFVVQNVARYIQSHEDAPVDPLLLEARKIAANSNVFRSNNQTQAILDGHAGTVQVAIALAGLNRGIEIAKQGEG